MCVSENEKEKIKEKGGHREEEKIKKKKESQS